GGSVGRVTQADDETVPSQRQIDHAAPENRLPPVCMPEGSESIEKHGRDFHLTGSTANVNGSAITVPALGNMARPSCFCPSMRNSPSPFTSNSSFCRMR